MVTPTPPCATPVSRSSGPRTRSQSFDTGIKTYSSSWKTLAAWEVTSTGLGDVNALYFTDKTSKYFTHLREILHLIDRQDL
ncbi:hypothetical protein Tco_1416433, partial [Tanacetum coccineum]